MDHRADRFSVFCDQDYFRNDEINYALRGRLLYAAVCFASASRLLCVCFFRDRAALALLLRLIRVPLAYRAAHALSYIEAYGRGKAYPSPKFAAWA